MKRCEFSSDESEDVAQVQLVKDDEFFTHEDFTHGEGTFN